MDATAVQQAGRTLEELDLLVLEYLIHTGCDTPAQALRTHLQQRALQPTHHRPIGDKVRQRIFEQALRAFDAGQGDELFALWESYVPPLVRRRDRTCQKLEFYMHIYFAVFPMHSLNPQRDARALPATMERFRRYLETNGATLSATAEFLAYYALPYVPQLEEHPAFRELLTPGWAHALRQRVADFLRSTPQLAAEPKLLTIYASYASLSVDGEHGVPRNPVAEASADLTALKARLVESELRLVETKQLAAQREAALHRAATELHRVASELQSRGAQAGATPRGSAEHRAAIQRAADAIAALGASPPPPQQQQQQQWSAGAAGGAAAAASGPVPYGGGYDASPPPPGMLGGGGGVADYPAQPPAQAVAAASAAGGELGDGPLSPERPPPPPRPRSVPLFAALDYSAVTRDLVELPAAERALLLQALRWRLMKSSGRQRQLVLAAFIQNDLLSARAVDAALDGSAPLVAEQLVRLVNHFASFAAGRAYILAKEGLLHRLSGAMLAEKADTPMRQNALGALQKLSLRRAPQSAMIDGGVVDWLAAVLADTDALSEYTIEYATALLMNLSLRAAGKRRCEAAELDILGVLNHLLEYDNAQVRTYVNGTLYSVLTRPALRERALEMGLPDVLEALLEHSEPMNARQIEYILPLLAPEAQPAQPAEEADDGDEEEDDDYDDDDDEDEPEDDDESEIPRPQAVPIGEELLASRYIASAYAAQAEASQLETAAPARRPSPGARAAAAKGTRNAAGGANASAEPPQRPITPNTHKPAPAPVSTSKAEYPGLDALEDDEAAFSSRNKLARTPGPGEHPAQGLGDESWAAEQQQPWHAQTGQVARNPAPKPSPKARKPPGGKPPAQGRTGAGAGGARNKPTGGKPPLPSAAKGGGARGGSSAPPPPPAAGAGEAGGAPDDPAAPGE